MIAKKSVLIILLIGVLLNTNLLFFTQVITGFFTLEDGKSDISLIDTDDAETNITFNNITTTCFLLKDGRKLCKVGTVKVSSGDVEDIDVIIRGGGSQKILGENTLVIIKKRGRKK